MKPLHECPARLQRMLLRLQQYKLNVSYKRGKELHIAVTLSRAYLPLEADDSLEEELEVLIVLLMSKERLEQLRFETQKDTTLQALMVLIQEGRPSKTQVIPCLQHYWDFKEELAVHDGVVFKNDKVVIPSTLHEFMLRLNVELEN